ncbi:MAG: LptF/LptG family permease [Saprospiraceae bacterium]|nr:LptF/LptG family permease [Saprospiraceae bacterium]MDW8483704.1 LptF/LptG family permease [Saprospiraceae bacterium]
MKKIDKLVFTSFLGPFVVSFAIALFVLIMQFLWLYIDDMAGKGLSPLILFEMISYLSISIFPMALPIAVLISSVMVMGNLAERYELSSMKSAGVSLLRIMRSLIIASVVIGVFSYVCSDYLSPLANLKFKSRLYDIRKQKPALAIEEGVFNDDFRQYIIRIGSKAKDGETIRDIFIEDQSQMGRMRLNEIMADSGQMFTTRDGRFFVMNLYNGSQYQEPVPLRLRKDGSMGTPFIRLTFQSWTKVWELSEFEMSRTDEDRFRGQRTMQTIKELRHSIDSLHREMDAQRRDMAEEILATFKRLKNKPDPANDPLEQERRRQQQQPQTTLPAHWKPEDPLLAEYFSLPKQKIEKPITEYSQWIQTFEESSRLRILPEALNQIRITKSIVERRSDQIEHRRKEAVKVGYELYSKYSFAIVCVIFLFIGGPMGAIIRKGGFGYPILVSIVFFVTFIMLTIMCRKLAELYLLTPFWAAMTPSIVMAPISAYLTWRALNDAAMFSTERIDRFVSHVRRYLEKRFLGS